MNSKLEIHELQLLMVGINALESSDMLDKLNSMDLPSDTLNLIKEKLYLQMEELSQDFYKKAVPEVGTYKIGDKGLFRGTNEKIVITELPGYNRYWPDDYQVLFEDGVYGSVSPKDFVKTDS